MKKRIQKGMKDPIPILEGLARIASGQSHPDFDQRIAVCETYNDGEPCEKREEDTAFGGFMCGECLCNLKALANSSKTCELGRWEEKD